MKSSALYNKIIGLVLLTLISCNENLDMDKQIPVLQSILISGESPKIVLAETIESFPSYAFDIKYFEQPFVINNYRENVTISVSDEIDIFHSFKSMFQDVSKDPNIPLGWGSNTLQYFIDDSFIVEAGKDYEINVTPLPDAYKNWSFKYIKAKTHVPNMVALNVVQLYDKPSTYNQDSLMQVYQISFDDPIDEKNYYYLSLLNVASLNDFSMDTISVAQIWKEYCSNPQRLVTMSFKHLRPRAALYYNTNNVKDKYQLFPGYLLSDEDFNGESFEIRLEYEMDSWNFKAEYLIAELMHVSKEYYNYYSSIYQQQYSQTDIYAEPVELYTNVENGLGVFAGASIDTKVIKIVSKRN